MNVILFELKNLQMVDDQLRLIRKTLAEEAAGLERAASGFKALSGRLTVARDELKAMQARHRELEGELADLSARQKTNEARQMNIKSGQEQAALAKEADFLAGRVGELEDETLELLDRIEQREAEIGGLTAAVEEESAAYERLAEATERARQSGRERLDELTARREKTAAALPEAQLRQYDEIARNRGGTAVAAAAGGLCLACRLGFPPQVYNDLQRNEKILTCPNCGRIIFWRDHPDFAEDDPPEAKG